MSSKSTYLTFSGKSRSAARRQNTQTHHFCLKILYMAGDITLFLSFTVKFYSSLTSFSLNAFAMTLTEDNDMAAAAMMGESRTPKNGYSSPAATGTPALL